MFLTIEWLEPKSVLHTFQKLLEQFQGIITMISQLEYLTSWSVIIVD